MNMDSIQNAFPSSLEEQTTSIWKKLRLDSKHENHNSFKVILDGEEILIPQRIYIDSKKIHNLSGLTKDEREICLLYFTRHNNGYIRESCLRQVISSNKHYSIPYILQLSGEYVIQIIDFIYEQKHLINSNNLVKYLAENPKHYEITKKRIYSYWDCYYSYKFPRRKPRLKPDSKTWDDYSGIKLIRHFDELIK